MIDFPKISALEFLNKVEPKKVGETTYFANKSTIFEALFDACGTNLSTDYLPPVSKNRSINETREKFARIAAIRADMKIRTHSADVTDSHFIDVALDSYIRGGGKYENFAKEMNLQKKMYEFKNLNSRSHHTVQFKQRVGAGQSMIA